MIRTSRFALAISASLFLSLGGAAIAQTAPAADKPAAAPAKKAPAAAAGKCVLAGGEANMITQGLAEFMAKAALKNSISGMGAKPVGEIKLDCSQNGALQYCKAAQRACK